MSYSKKGKHQSKPGSRTPAKATVNRERQHQRETVGIMRRQAQEVFGVDRERQADHLPGNASDRFGQVYRKGGPKVGVDTPNDDRSGRGFATPEVR